MNGVSTIKAIKAHAPAPQQKAVIQPKLMVNAPGDSYEQEADAMADHVMRMPQVSAKPVGGSSLIGRSVQRKCAHCEEEKRKNGGGNFIQRQCDACKEDESRKKNAGGTIMRKVESGHAPFFGNNNQSVSGNFMQRQCDHCKEEEKKKNKGMLMRKSVGNDGFEASEGLASQLSSSRGSGSPLSDHTRGIMENAFSADFSIVRIHTGNAAASMNGEVDAKAFTYGNDIYFNRDQYAPESYTGKKLLAHELTHVVQQTGPATIQRDDGEDTGLDIEEGWDWSEPETHDTTNDVQEDETVEPEESTDEESAEESAEEKAVFDPEAVVFAFLIKLGWVAAEYWNDDPNDTAEPDEDYEPFAEHVTIVDNTEADEMEAAGDVDEDTEPEGEIDVELQGELIDIETWLGIGPDAIRRYLLIYAEFLRTNNETYAKKIVEKYSTGEYEDPAREYLINVRYEADKASATEPGTLSAMNSETSLGLTDTNYIDDPVILWANGANAFPDFSWSIVKRLIKAPDLYPSLSATVNQFSNAHIADGTALPLDFFRNGLPLSYTTTIMNHSFGFHYSIVKRMLFPVGGIPDEAWVIKSLILPEDVELHTEKTKHYVSSFASLVPADFRLSILNSWQRTPLIKWDHFNTLGISSFRNEYPNGLQTLDKFYGFSFEGAVKYVDISALAIFTNVSAGGADPYSYLSERSKEANKAAAIEYYRLLSEEFQRFAALKADANGRLNELSGPEKLLKAVQWSYEKGYAGDVVRSLLDRIDEIFKDVAWNWLKERAKSKLFSLAGRYGGTYGKMAAAGYTAYTWIQDLSDVYEMIDLAKSLIDIIDEASTSSSIEDTQYSAARLADASETILQQLIEGLFERLLDSALSSTKKFLKTKTTRDSSGHFPSAIMDKLMYKGREIRDKPLDNKDILDAELQKAIETKDIKKPSPDDTEHDAVIDLPNTHTWKRKTLPDGRHIWCRESDRCFVPGAESDLYNELDHEVDQHLSGEEDAEDIREFLKRNDVELMEDEDSTEMQKAAHDRAAQQHYELRPSRTKGTYAESTADEHMDSLKYRKVGGHNFESGAAGTQVREQGIDGVYRLRHPPYTWVIVEAKFVKVGSKAQYKHTDDGKQMSHEWIKKNLEAAVGTELAKQILQDGYERLCLEVTPGRPVRERKPSWN